MQRLGLTTLVAIELPGHTARLTDGGFVTWGGHTWAARDSLLGSIASLNGLREGSVSEVPALDLSLLPHPNSAPADLVKPGFQQSPVRIWQAEYDPAAGTVTGDPDLQFDGVLDRATLEIRADSRELQVQIVSSAERLFERNPGSPISPTLHKTLFPGETGQDSASGLLAYDAWGVESPSTGTQGGGWNGGGVPSWRNQPKQN